MKSKRMREVEAELGQPLEVAIPRIYEETGGRLTVVADRLGINYITLWGWLGRLGIRVKRVAELVS